MNPEYQTLERRQTPSPNDVIDGPPKFNQQTLIKEFRGVIDEFKDQIILLQFALEKFEEQHYDLTDWHVVHSKDAFVNLFCLSSESIFQVSVQNESWILNSVCVFR